MKKRRLPEAEFKVNMTPMIDVVFQLMIFFMCTIEFKTLDAKLSAYLPRGMGPNDDPNAELIQPIDILVEAVEPGTRLDPATGGAWLGYGPYRFGDDRVMRYRVASKEMTDLSSLKERLRALHAAEPERKVKVIPGDGAIYTDLVQLVDAAVGAGFTDITFKGAHRPMR